ncbi:uncharacterized protein PRCAT00000090001 [Priceomyces carsonii]|uniref:uncharacterized protein n=1 Tax=Priceomyces carsonii TaxID=28549 RepID=UPI002ED86E87|nr:unnamed protein product [Priceomyces carsonii]
MSSGHFHHRDSSSSSEDESGGFQSHIQLPAVNLSNYRKQNAKTSSTVNLSKAGKKLRQPKSVRFPDLCGARLSIISNTSSNTNNSSASDISLPNSERADLPDFRIKPSDIKSPDISDEESDVDLDAVPAQTFPSHVPDSSDDDDNDARSASSKASKKSSKSSSSKKSLSSKASSPSKGPSPPAKNEMDITDQRRKSSSSSGSGERVKGLKSILRKMSLSDHAHPNSDRQLDDHEMSNSDTFLGRVLNAGGQSMSGGGLAPGASQRSNEGAEDEEKNIGLSDNDGEAIEMKKIDFNSLNSEAKKLISAHIPGADSLTNTTPDVSDYEDSSKNDSDAHLLDKEQENTGNKENNNEDKNKTFYAPNPDYYVRGESDDSLKDEFLLDEAHEGIVPPKKVHAGVLSSLLKLYQNPQEIKSSSSLAMSDGATLADYDFDDNLYNKKGTSTFDFTELKSGLKKGPKLVANMASKLGHHRNKASSSRNSEEHLNPKNIDNSSDDGDDNNYEMDASALPSFQNARPKGPKKASGTSVPAPSKFSKKLKQHRREAEQRLRITVHIADILQRQRFIIRMCKALMLFGAPTHRLEEYMVMTSRVLEIDGQFIYFPGCMIISFGDVATRTSEVHLVRCAQGLNLSKLSFTHKIYKDVIHDLIGVEEAAQKLEQLLKDKNKYPPWLCVLFYGLGSALVCPFAFSGGWYDVPVVFGIGLCVGYLQYFVSSISNLYSSVFEVSSSIVVSFISRGIGSINGGKTFCFSALAQGALALILPGYIILCGSLELQSRNLVAGSVRMFYAIIYSLFLGFGITLGAALFGWVGHVHDTNLTCEHKINDKFKILFVPMFSIILGLINQASFSQLPIMIIISCTGYVGTYFAGKYFSEVTEFTACIGAFIVGILGNMYSRIFKGMAVSAMLPAIFVQVPSGIASHSTLLSGVKSANKITQANSTSSSDSGSDSLSLSFGVSMVEVSIGISVGLFAAALVVYPFGKKRTGLFTL